MIKSSSKAGLRFIREKPFQAFLCLVIVAGLLCKLYLSIHLDLNSDAVAPGMVLMELFKHGNYGLTGYTFPLLDSYLYDDILPFHAAAQVLSGYDPLALVGVSYVLFLVILAVFGTIALYVSRDVTKMLVFVALAATLNPVSYFFYASPAMHNGTILFAGIFLFLFLTVREKSWKFMALATVASCVIVYSDSIFLAYFVFPAVAGYLLWERKTAGSLLGTAIFCAASVGAHLVKNYLPGFKSNFDQLTLLSVADMGPKGSLLVQRLAELMGGAPGSPFAANGLSLLGSLGLLLLVLLAVAAAFHALGQRSRESRYLQAIVLASCLIFCSALVLTTVPLNDFHYLTFAALAFLLLLAVSLPTGRLPALLLAALLLAGLVANLQYAFTLSSQPNAVEHGLIEALESHNLTYGYGNYWDANVVTYLSGERVKIRPIEYDEASGGYVPAATWTCEQWYTTAPPDFFLVSNSADYPLPHSLPLPYRVPPERYYESDTCLIYVYNESSTLHQLISTAS